MEQNFQTSFIPKKPMVVERSAPPSSIGFFTIIAIFILFTVLLATGGLYFYKGVLTKKIADMKDQLVAAKGRLEASKISELQVLDKRLQSATKILDQHVAVTPVFQNLSALTMKTVRFTKFSYTLGNDKDTKVKIKMSGIAVGYRSVALQADLFANKDEGKHFINPIFSNLTLDDKGNVLFDLDFSVDQNFVNYKQTVQTTS